MNEALIKKVIEYPTFLASTDLQLHILFGNRLYELKKQEAIHLTDTMKVVIENISDYIIEQANPSNSLATTKELLIRAFTYCFDKNLEMVYNLRIQNENEVEFNLEDMLLGFSGDKVPEYIQLKVTPIIPIVGEIFIKTFDFAMSLEKEFKSTYDSVRSIIYGAMQLGIEFCLRIDLNDQSELEKYLYS